MPKQPAREHEIKGRRLVSSRIGEFVLLSSEKLGRVLDIMEGIEEAPPTKVEACVACMKLKKRDDTILAMYDLFGGAVKLEGRKINMGTFYDFAARTPKTNVKIAEESYEDEYVLIKKKTKKAKSQETTSQRIKRLEKTEKTEKTEKKEKKEEEEEEEEEADEYDDMTSPELKKALRSKKLSPSGKVAELRERLRADDDKE